MDTPQNPISPVADGEEIIHDLNVENLPPEIPMKKTLSIFALVIVGGILSGFILSYIGNATSSSKSTTTSTEGSSNSNVIETAGIEDKKTFKDSVEGTLEDGGFEGEGSHHLTRPGGDSQTVYLTSSTVDLSEYEGKKVRVHGETFDAQKVGWLMDVGFVEVLK